MKVNIIKDDKGAVVATFEKGASGSPFLKPMLKPGHTVHEVDAADDYKADIKAFYKRHSR